MCRPQTRQVKSHRQDTCLIHANSLSAREALRPTWGTGLPYWNNGDGGARSHARSRAWTASQVSDTWRNMMGRSGTARKKLEPAQWLTVQQVADRFRAARATVLRWIQSGRLTGIRVGRVRRIALGDLPAFTCRGAWEAGARRARGPRALGTKFTLSHPLWDLVGKGSGGRANVSGNKYKYVARAIDRRCGRPPAGLAARAEFSSSIPARSTRSSTSTTATTKTASHSSPTSCLLLEAAGSLYTHRACGACRARTGVAAPAGWRPRPMQGGGGPS